MTLALDRIADELGDVRDDRRRTRDEMHQIHERAAGRELTAGEAERWRRCETHLASLDAALDRLEGDRDRALAQRDLLRTAGQPGSPYTVVSGDQSAGETRERFNTTRAVDTADVLRDARRLGGSETRDGSRALAEAALRTIDAWPTPTKPEWRENAARLIDGAGEVAGLLGPDGERRVDHAARIAEHIVRCGSADYRRAFARVIASPSPTEALALLPENLRAAMAEGSTTTGGFMLPTIVDPTILLTNAGITNPFRALATVKTITTRDWNGITSAGVTAEWMGEAAQANDNSPTIARPTITTIRANAYVQASFEMLEDTDLASELPMVFTDARDNLEGTAFATGTGSTQPYGVVTELNLVTASRTAANTNGTLGAVDIYNLDNNLPARWRADGSFVANKSVWNIVRQLGATLGQTFWTDLGGARPAELIGYPVYESSAMFNAPLSTATASNDAAIVLGDFRRGYTIVDRIGMSVAYNPLVVGTSQRPTGEVGWFAYWRVGARVVRPQAFQMLIV